MPGDGWFKGFKKRHGLSVRRATNVCEKEPADKMSAIPQLNIRRTALDGQTISPLGQWYAASVANMDQTPLPFTFADGQRGEVCMGAWRPIWFGKTPMYRTVNDICRW